MTGRGPMRAVAALIFVAWFCAMLKLGLTDHFMTAPRVFGLAPVQQAIVFPLLIFWIAYFSISPVRHFVRTADLTALVALQGIRILALSHLVSWGYGLMAGSFALPVAFGNLLVSILALTMVTAVAERRGRWVLRVYLLTFIGIAEFLMTIALAVLGFFSAPLSFDPSVDPRGYVSFATVPLSLFPTYAIPALLVMHCVTLVALRHRVTVRHETR